METFTKMLLHANKMDELLSAIRGVLWFLYYYFDILVSNYLLTSIFIGLFIFILGLSILIIATVNFLNTTINLPITKEIYRYSRHPMYFANFIIFLGTGIAAASWIIIIISILFLILANIYVVAEERYCLKRYSNLYKKYIDGTPKWLGVPKL